MRCRVVVSVFVLQYAMSYWGGLQINLEAGWSSDWPEPLILAHRVELSEPKTRIQIGVIPVAEPFAAA